MVLAWGLLHFSMIVADDSVLELWLSIWQGLGVDKDVEHVVMYVYQFLTDSELENLVCALSGVLL